MEAAVGNGGGFPAFGWQKGLLPLLNDLAAQDRRIRDVRSHGSTSGLGADIDRWSDLDLMIVTEEPADVAEALAERIGNRVSPVYTSNRSGDCHRYTLRLVLADLRRVDITAAVPGGGVASSSSAETVASGGSAMEELINSFRFDAVLAAVKAAREDILIGGHLTLQLGQHVLVAAMLLRDRDAGRKHHRFGRTRWDIWAGGLAATPAPYTRPGITAAIRHYVTALEHLLSEWDSGLHYDSGPLIMLLDAVDES